MYMWNGWCRACVEAGRLGVVFQHFRVTSHPSAKPGMNLHWYFRYIPMLYSNDIPDISTVSFFTFSETKNTPGWKCSCGMNVVHMGWLCCCFMASGFLDNAAVARKWQLWMSVIQSPIYGSKKQFQQFSYIVLYVFVYSFLVFVWPSSRLSIKSIWYTGFFHR